MRYLNDGEREVLQLVTAHNQALAPVKKTSVNLGGNWRPIETGPLDGTCVLLWGHFIPDGKGEFTEPLYGHYARNQWQAWGPDGRYVVKATNWHPLPDRP